MPKGGPLGAAFSLEEWKLSVWKLGNSKKVATEIG